MGVDPQPPDGRTLNPERQQARFDPDDAYVNRYVPDRDNYPPPIVDHAVARQEALERYRAGT